jgi:cation diffusion facilitator CzcD-associated flavoprotein CzcO
MFQSSTEDRSDRPRVCVIGAGSSGITACQNLDERGVEFSCFEKGSDVGGIWRYRNDNGMSAAYRSLHINTSREMMEYSAFPMPVDYPDYPGHAEIAAYFEDFVDHFGLRDRIEFNTEVVSVEPVESGWMVTVEGPEGRRTESFTDVMVCNGHHWNPRWPEPAFPGADGFTGEQIHSHDYKTPEILEGKTVLILGIGNSATDIAVESSRVADRTLLAMRRGAWIVPKYIFGIPTDRLTTFAPMTRMPLGVQSAMMRLTLRLTQGRITDSGLPMPDHRPLHAHPTVSDELLGRLGHGDITVKPNIDRFEGGTVFFEDGSSEDVDVVIFCTGYRITFPFLDSSVIDVTDNQVELYKRVVPVDRPGLYFIGLVQPLGPIMPLSEAQASWVADLIAGQGALPDRSEMARDIALERSAMDRRYVSSKRHTIQVDFDRYLRTIGRERRRSRDRVRLPA